MCLTQIWQHYDFFIYNSQHKPKIITNVWILLFIGIVYQKAVNFLLHLLYKNADKMLTEVTFCSPMQIKDVCAKLCQCNVCNVNTNRTVQRLHVEFQMDVKAYA